MNRLTTVDCHMHRTHRRRVVKQQLLEGRVDATYAEETLCVTCQNLAGLGLLEERHAVECCESV